jgi:hypothetical protein
VEATVGTFDAASATTLTVATGTLCAAAAAGSAGILLGVCLLPVAAEATRSVILWWKNKREWETVFTNKPGW